MEAIIDIFYSYGHIIAGVGLGIAFLSLLLVILLIGRQKKQTQRLNKLFRGMENKNLEEMLHAHLATVNDAVETVREVNASYKQLRRMAEKSIQQIGVVRFNAFTDTGSDLSFSVAMLDNDGDGIVISSIFGRNDQRVYAKPIKKGVSAYQLSSEEEDAIRLALQGR